MKRQLERLLAPGWLARTPAAPQHFARYLKAAWLRDKPAPIRARCALPPISAPLQAGWLPKRRRRHVGVLAGELEQFGWLLEELRVALFAQELKTPVPVSAKRLGKLWQSMRK